MLIWSVHLLLLHLLDFLYTVLVLIAEIWFASVKNKNTPECLSFLKSSAWRAWEIPKAVNNLETYFQLFFDNVVSPAAILILFILKDICCGVCQYRLFSRGYGRPMWTFWQGKIILEKKSFWSGFILQIWKSYVADSRFVLYSICSFLNMKS